MRQVGFDSENDKLTVFGSKRDYYCFDIPQSKKSYKSEIGLKFFDV